MKETSTLVDKWIINVIVLLLVLTFVAIVGMVLALAWNQIVWHSGETTSYASEFVGILNSILLISVGVFFSSVMGKVFGIKKEDIQSNVDQSVKTSKQAGLEMMVDKAHKSPDVDSDEIK